MSPRVTAMLPVFGDPFGLVVETAPDAGTKVSMRVPKFHPAVRAAVPT